MPDIIRVQITMAGRRVLTMWSPVEVRAIIQYYWTWRINVFAILESLHTMYCEEVMSRQMVGRWCCIFNKEDRLSRMKDEMDVPTHPQMKTALLEYRT
ncbi:hypothetical protein TNCV_4789621 [Trichonephila clavipes]|nr:hypothetical protein TNCV_4789621 [Trichonephila clavipes]